MMNPEGHEKSGPPPPGVPPPYGINPPVYQPSVPPPVMHPVIQTTVIQPAAAALGPEPVSMVCPSCHATITSKTSPETSSKTHMIALAMCLCGLWPCCLIPYCVDTCRNTNHNCPACQAYLGQYKR